MKRFGTLLMVCCVVTAMNAQDAWRFARTMRFPATDTAYARPYFCTVTSTGRVYVLSSTVADASGRNAIFFADSNSSTLTKMIDYFLNGESDTLTGNIAALRGIASVGRDVLIDASVPYRRSQPFTVGTMYYYPNGDTASVGKYGYYFSSAGHGTYHHGVALTRDTICFAAVSALATGPGPGPRLYNFRYGLATPARGSWFSGTYQVEPGGVHSAGFDIMRDCAVHPSANYDDSTVAWFSSRNSLSATQVTGGIAIWRGGRQIANPAGYRGQRVQDPFGLLALGPSISCGITVDRFGYLWVAGIDSTRRWVKAFDVSGAVATEMFELPSQNSVPNPDPAGAPMLMPVDVALSPNGRTAYVPDAAQRVVYQFKYGPPVGVGDPGIRPFEFALDQNFPNPFNPATKISFTLPQRSRAMLVVTDILGRKVATLADEVMESGRHARLFEAANLSSGIYFATLSADGLRSTKKMMLVR